MKDLGEYLEKMIGNFNAENPLLGNYSWMSYSRARLKKQRERIDARLKKLERSEAGVNQMKADLEKESQ